MRKVNLKKGRKVARTCIDSRITIMPGVNAQPTEFQRISLASHIHKFQLVRDRRTILDRKSR
jgi:hypothetical protein